MGGFAAGGAGGGAPSDYTPPTPGTYTGGGKVGGGVPPAGPQTGFETGASTNRFNPIVPNESGGRGTETPAGPTEPSAFDLAAKGMQDAYAGYGDLLNFDPLQVSAGSYNPYMIGGFDKVRAMMLDPNSTDFQAAQFQQADREKFMNPYTGEVIDQSMADIERGRLMQANQAAAQAQAAGAFGGSRGALMEAEIARNALDTSARTAAGLRDRGFQFASQMGQMDATRRQQALQQNAQQQMQAMLANQRSDLQAGMTNARLGMQRSIANQNAYNMGQQFNIGQDMAAQMANQGADLSMMGNRLGALAGLGNLSNLGFNQGMTTLDRMSGVDATQRGILDALYGAGRGEYGAGITNSGQNQLNMLLSAIGGVPIPGTTTNTSSPGLLDLGTSAAMMYNLFGFSDVRLKDGITKIGQLDSGVGIYKWKWNDTARAMGVNTPEVGVLAQEVIKVMPEAVIEGADGYLRVNYGMVA